MISAFLSRPTRAALFLLTPTLAAASCGHYADDCRESLTCSPPNDLSGGAASGGTAGGSGGQGSGGLGGNPEGGMGIMGGGGADGGAGGAAGGGSVPCDGACGGDAPVCDEAANRCVGCVTSGDCAAPTPVCYLSTHACVECLSRSQCSGNTPACDTMTHSCVECLSRSDCKAPTAACVSETHQCAACAANTDCKAPTSLCEMTSHSCVACVQSSDCKDTLAARCDAETHTCMACAGDADCEHFSATPACFEGKCVECTGKNNSACGVDSASGDPFVCDSLKRTCSTDTEHSTGLCGACVSDAQCMAGQLCVKDTLGTGDSAKDVGYFCHWKKGDTRNGAPALCNAARPYVRTVMSVTSIDGEIADICTLRTSSCPARNQFSSKNCGPTPDDTLCGVSPPNDAKCAQFDVEDYRCTMTCLGNDDCLSPSTCNGELSPPVCTFF